MERYGNPEIEWHAHNEQVVDLRDTSQFLCDGIGSTRIASHADNHLERRRQPVV
jgi:hypothetical protein